MRNHQLPRLLPNEPLPPYTYVTGKNPHPRTHPAGHHFGIPAGSTPPTADSWHDCRAYLYGIDLFNHGYYWEAHEQWEGIWHLFDRNSLPALFFQGLIFLAAAGVKRLAGHSEGVEHLCGRATRRFEEVKQRLGAGEDCYYGLRLSELRDAQYVYSLRMAP